MSRTLTPPDRRRRNLDVIPNDNGIRPAGKPDECLYCRKKIGEIHDSECVIIVQAVEMIATFRESEMSLTFMTEVPASWDTRDIEFRFNESTWCADNLEVYCGALKEILKVDSEGCLCGLTTVRYLRKVDPLPYISATEEVPTPKDQAS